MRIVCSWARAEGAGWPVSGGQDPMAVIPVPRARLPCGAGSPPRGAPPTLAGSVRVPCSCAADERADGAVWPSLLFSSWFSCSFGRRSHPCMPRAAETRSACLAA